MLPTFCDRAETPIPDNRPLDGDLDERPAPIFFWNFISKGKPLVNSTPWNDPEWQKETMPLVKLMGNIPTRNFMNFYHSEIAPTDYLGARVMFEIVTSLSSTKRGAAVTLKWSPLTSTRTRLR